MGSRVVAKTQDLLWEEGEGYVHIQRREGTERGGRFPARSVGPRGPTFAPGWVRPEGAERKTPDELARELSEAVKPKLYAHDGRADAYPRAPT